jgi:cardiolipin synthase
MWIIVLIFLPSIGLVFYIFFGQNYRKVKIFNRKTLRDLKYIDRMIKQQLYMVRNDEIFEYYPDKSKFKNIITLLLNNSKALLTEYNKINIYHDGKSTFNSIKKALLAANDSIHLEFYIIDNDNIGNEIKDILIRKAKEGVEVRVIYDDVGSWHLPKKYIKELKNAGIDIFPFMRVTFPSFTSKINYRNHRKIIVIDGKVGFMGGINIADRYIDGGTFGHWRDTHLRIEGEAVQMLQVIFLVDWYFVSKEILLRKRKKYFPGHFVDTRHLVQLATSGPDSDWASIMQAYFAAINNAKHHIYIITPYFTPNESILTAIKTASLSGIDVRLILPHKSESKLVYWSTLSYLTELMEAGVKVHLYRKGFNHAKAISIDGIFAAVGSANIDVRSFEHNFEITAIIYDEEITKKLERQFHADIRNSIQINLKEWNKRPFYTTFKEGFARLFTPLL